MTKEEIATGIRNAIERGESMDEAMQTLINAGYKSVEWTTANNSGSSVASGVYFYRLDASGIGDRNKSFNQVKKMIVLK